MCLSNQQRRTRAHTHSRAQTHTHTHTHKHNPLKLEETLTHIQTLNKGHTSLSHQEPVIWHCETMQEITLLTGNI